MAEWSTALLLTARCPHQLGLLRWSSGLRRCYWLLAVSHRLGLPRWSSGLRRCYWLLAVSHQLGLPRWSSGLRRCYWLLAVLTNWACPDGRVVYGVATDCSPSSPTGPAPMVEWSTGLLLIARVGIPAGLGVVYIARCICFCPPTTGVSRLRLYRAETCRWSNSNILLCIYIIYLQLYSKLLVGLFWS